MGERGMQVQSAERIDGWRDRRWRAVVIVVERARSTERAADTQRQRQILRPTHHPSAAVGRLSGTALRASPCGPAGPRRGHLDWLGIPALRAGDVSRPVLPTVLDGSFRSQQLSDTSHTPRTRLPRTSVRDTVRTSAHAVCYPRRLQLFM